MFYERPFMLPVLEFKKGEHYKILNNKKSEKKTTMLLKQLFFLHLENGVVIEIHPFHFQNTIHLVQKH